MTTTETRPDAPHLSLTPAERAHLESLGCRMVYHPDGGFAVQCSDGTYCSPDSTIPAAYCYAYGEIGGDGWFPG